MIQLNKKSQQLMFTANSYFYYWFSPVHRE